MIVRGRTAAWRNAIRNLVESRPRCECRLLSRREATLFPSPGKRMTSGLLLSFVFSIAACSSLTGQGRWTLQPDLPLGTEHELYMVSSVQLESSKAFVLNSSSGNVLVFDAGDGTLLDSFGRLGEGPGEFRFPTRLWVVRDTAVVWDLRSRRLSVFDLTGPSVELVHEFTSRDDISVRGVLTGLRVLATSIPNRYGVTDSHAQARDEDYLLIDLRNGNQTEHLATHPGPLGILVQGRVRSRVREPIFAREVEVFVKSEWFWIGLNDSPAEI